MGIKVKHSPSAAAIGESAYTVGRGQRIERDIRFATETGLKRQAIGVQGQSAALQAKSRAAALEQREKESGRLHGLREEELGFRKQQWEDEPSRQLQKGLEEQKRLQSKVSWQYDEGQKKEMAKVTTGVAWLREQVAAGKWTPEQAEQAEAQLWKKYHAIIPLPLYDDKASLDEQIKGRTWTHPTTGKQYWMNDKGNPVPFDGDEELQTKLLLGIYKIHSDRYDPETMKPMAVDMDAVRKEYGEVKKLFAQENEQVTQAEKEQARLQQNAVKKLQEQEAQQQQQVEQQKARQQAAVENLPVMFEAIVKGQPKIGRKGYPLGPGIVVTDKVLGEEAYNEILNVTTDRAGRDGVPPEIVKAKFDEWWDEQHDKERGERFQKFGDRMKFKGAAQETPEELRKGGTRQDYKRGVELGYWE